MSVGQEMIGFLTPSFNEPIQLIFFTLMMGGAVFTVIKVKLSATPENWEQKWNGGTVNDFSDDLDAEHGSVSDISNAVATSWEKLSEAMPGILLILGLLGTFLGLGIALNNASGILDSASMDDSMAKLNVMMDGLGTKFKTSTWGIFAFLALKIWISYDGFEESRLRWCIRKIKGELDNRRAAAQKQQQGEHQQFIAAIGQLGERLCHTLHNEISDNRSVLQKNQDLLSKKVELLMENNASALTTTNLLALQLEKSETIINNDLKSRKALEEIIKQHNDRLCNTLQSEISNSRIVLKENQDLLSRKIGLSIESNASAIAATKLLALQLEKSEIIINNGLESRTALETLIKQQNDRLCKTLQSEISDSRVVLQNNQDLLALGVELSKESNASALATRTALESFVEANTDNLESMKKSSSEMADAASRVGESAVDLKSAIGSFKDGVADVLDSLKSDLNETFEQMSAQNRDSAADLKATIGALQSGVSEVMATMKSDLSESISEMNDSFGKNMGKMSADLEEATTGIAGAINMLSTNVKDIMTSIAEANHESLKSQKVAREEFIVTSDTLNRNVEEMTNSIGGITEEMINRLGSVAETNRQNKLNCESLKTMVNEFSLLAGDVKSTASSLDYLSNNIKIFNENESSNKSLSEITEVLKKIDHSIFVVAQRVESNQIGTEVSV